MRFPVIIALIAVCALAGCANGPKILRTASQTPPVPSYHSESDTVPLRRVAVLPINFEEQGTVNPTGLDAVFNTELAKTSAFEVVPISRQDLLEHYGTGPISSVRIIPGDLLAHLAREYAVDGVLFTDVTHYFPYRPIAIGVRCKLVDARTGVERWVFDHTFDSGSPDIAVAAKNFAAKEQSEQTPITNDGESILDSPTEFGKYVAHEAYRSMLGI
jgi:hypothetical protein